MKPSSSNPQTLVGVLLGGKYRVARVLGRGGMGTVLLARHEELDQRFAIKLLLGELASEADCVARFMREARAAAKLQSEHVARVSDVGKFEGIGPYMVMEYLSGLDLGQLVVSRGPVPPSDAVDYVLEALDAISEAHVLGIVHRDIKPSNLFLAELADGRKIVKVLDFGISKIDPVLDAGPTHHKLTSTHAVLGSPAYISPEQLKNASDVDARADIWSLGVVLYELLTGELPFQAETAGALFAKIVSEEPDPISKHRPTVVPTLNAAVMRCLRRNPDERYESVGALAAALAPFGSGRASKEAERAQSRFYSAPPVSQTGMTQRGTRDTSHGTHATVDRETLDAATRDGREVTIDAGKAIQRTQGSWTGSQRPPRTSYRLAGVALVAACAVLGAIVAYARWGGGNGSSRAGSATDMPAPIASSSTPPSVPPPAGPGASAAAMAGAPSAAGAALPEAPATSALAAPKLTPADSAATGGVPAPVDPTVSLGLSASPEPASPRAPVAPTTAHALGPAPPHPQATARPPPRLVHTAAPKPAALPSELESQH